MPDLDLAAARAALAEQHFSIERMAQWLGGRLEPEEVEELLLPHLLARCRECREMHQEIERRMREMGLFRPEVAVLEGRQAPELWAELEPLPYAERFPVIARDKRFHTWGLCRLLQQKCRETSATDPRAAVELGTLALALWHHLGKHYDPDLLEDLKALGLGSLANARRALGELHSAEADLEEALAAHRGSRSENPIVDAELAWFRALLRHDQRRLHEAVALLDRAYSVYSSEDYRDRLRAGQVLSRKAQCLREIQGKVEGPVGTEAVAVAQEAVRAIEEDSAPSLAFEARQELVRCLVAAGRSAEAERLLPALTELASKMGDELAPVRARWAQGRVAADLKRWQSAEEALVTVKEELAERELFFDMVLVIAELASVRLSIGAPVKPLAAEVVVALGSREMSANGAVAVMMLHEALDKERLTPELAQHLGAFLESVRGPRLPPDHSDEAHEGSGSRRGRPLPDAESAGGRT